MRLDRRHSVRLAAAAAAMLVTALLPAHVAARPFPQNTYSGKWQPDPSNPGCPNAFANLTQNGSSVSGEFGPCIPGTDHGTVSDGVLTGTWAFNRNSGPNDRGTIRWKLSPDGHEIEGSDGNWRCVSGSCLNNVAGLPDGSYDWSFKTYANNVKVVPPLVGSWQLGPATGRGGGQMVVRHGKVTGMTGSVAFRFYGTHGFGNAAVSAAVTGISSLSSTPAGSPRLDQVALTLRITSSTRPHNYCREGTIGTLTLASTDVPLSNGKSREAAAVTWGSACPTFEMGWANEDGGERTSPSFGGPPHGGEWAIVDLRLPG